MDVFSLRDRVIQDYADYVRSFVQVRDRRIDEFVQKSLRDEVLWPQPLIQLNPSFEPGGWVDDLVDRKIRCQVVFSGKNEIRYRFVFSGKNDELTPDLQGCAHERTKDNAHAHCVR